MHRLWSHITAYRSKNRYQIILALLALGMFAVIEYNQHYYFLKTDNLDQNLPYYVHNLRSVLSGEFPLFNFHQFLGTPVFSCIQSAALYPPNYLAAILSRVVLGHFYGTIEIIAAFHLICAAIGFFQLMRYWNLSNSSSLFGAVAWTFCGFVIRVGDGWIQVIEYAAFFPWILLYSVRLASRFQIRSFILLTMLRTLAFFVGNPPFFLYLVTFDILFTVVYSAVALPGEASGDRDQDGKRSGPRFGSVLMRQAASYLSVMLLSLPLLLPAFHQVQLSADRNNPLTWERYSQAGSNLLLWIKGLLVPLSRQQYLTEGNHLFFSYIGWFTLFFALCAPWIYRHRWRLAITFLVLAVFALLWANNTFVTQLVYHLPIYNRQRFPFKLLFFTSFFIIALSCLGYDVVYKNFTGKYRKAQAVFAILFAAHVVSFLAVHLLSPYENRRIKEVPYQEKLKDLLADGRIVTIVDKDTDEQDKHPYLLGYNYATLFGLYHFAGYETLISQANLSAALERNSSADFYVDNNRFAPLASDLEHFRRWGVRWYVLEKKVDLQQNCCLKLFASDDKRVIAYDEGAMPFVFWEDTGTGAGIKFHFSTNSLTIATERNTPDRLVANILFNDFFKATVDGIPSQLASTADTQVAVRIPAGKHTIKIRYTDPYFTVGLCISSAFMIAVSILLWLRARRM